MSDRLPPVSQAARHALAMGAALTVVAITVVLLVYMTRQPPG